VGELFVRVFVVELVNANFARRSRVANGRSDAMTTRRLIPRMVLLGVVLGFSSAAVYAQGERPSALTVRLIHPERQAAEVLRLFEGSGAKSPAEVLSRWKTVAQEPAILGKPLEAVIAMMNPEMAAEWRVFDQMQFRAEGTGSGHWFAIVPHDDGTVAAVLTAMRLTYDEETPLMHAGRRLAVARLSQTGFPIACQVGPTVVVASSREDLSRGLGTIATVPHHASGTVVGTGGQVPRANPRRPSLLGSPIDSGIEFEIDPAEIVPAPSASVLMRRLLVLVRSLSGARMVGSATLSDGSVSAVVRAFRPDMVRNHRDDPLAAVVHHEWLSLIPVDHLMAFVCVALDLNEQGRDAAFALIDQVDRADPARARVAATRTRLNLLAAAVGLRPEVDVWPHLKGVSAAIRGDSHDLGAIAGGWLILHLDRPETAAKLLEDTIPRIAASALGSGKTKNRAARADAGKRNSGTIGISQPLSLGTLASLPVFGWQADGNLVIAWGDDALEASRITSRNAGRGVAAVCENWRASGKPSPARAGAVWPGRFWIAPRKWYDAPATKVVVDLPPIVWWGWNEPGATTDLLEWTGLRPATKRLVQALPMAANPVP
jgi:hypothetical protein